LLLVMFAGVFAIRHTLISHQRREITKYFLCFSESLNGLPPTISSESPRDVIFRLSLGRRGEQPFGFAKFDEPARQKESCLI
jgi:hypothetical protein